MKTEIYMPAMSPSMTEGTLTKWLVKIGDQLKIGDPIAEIETDKATMEVESQIEGVMSEFLVENGQDQIAIKTPIAIIETTNSTEKLKGKLFTNTIDDQPKKKSTKGPYIDQDKRLDKITVREAIRDAIAEEMRIDKNVFVMGEEVAEYQGAYKVTQGLLQEFGAARVIDTPITENGFAGLAIGASFSGLKPVVEFMTFNFSLQAMDHIINSAAKTLYMGGGQLNCPIVFRGPNGAAARVAAQHSQDLTAWFSHIPGLKVISPFTASDHKGLLKAAIRDPNPVIFLENEILYSHKSAVPVDTNFEIPLGKANTVFTGKDVTIVSYSIMVSKSIEAAKILNEKNNIDVELIDLQTIRPLDQTTIIESVKKTNRLVVVEEAWPFASVGSEIASLIQYHAFDYLDAPIYKINSADVPMPYSSVLENKYLPQVEDIVLAVEEVCYI